MALMFLRSRSHVKASMILMRADDLCIHNYIISLLNNILKSEPTERHRKLYICGLDLSSKYIYIYIYIYI